MPHEGFLRATVAGPLFQDLADGICRLKRLPRSGSGKNLVNNLGHASGSMYVSALSGGIIEHFQPSLRSDAEPQQTQSKKPGTIVDSAG
jgi:hypothetical protein